MSDEEVLVQGIEYIFTVTASEEEQPKKPAHDRLFDEEGNDEWLINFPKNAEGVAWFACRATQGSEPNSIWYGPAVLAILGEEDVIENMKEIHAEMRKELLG